MGSYRTNVYQLFDEMPDSRASVTSVNRLFSIPEFDGNYPQAWLSRANFYFKKNPMDTVEEWDTFVKVKYVYYFMSGVAEIWFVEIFTDEPKETWESFCEKMLHHFTNHSEKQNADDRHDIGSEVKEKDGLLRSQLQSTNVVSEGVEVNVNRLSENRSKLDGTEDINKNQNESKSMGEETWEECGCMLGDLSASEAQFMVQNLILEVLLANLTLSQSSRSTEISLGIIGNLAYHKISRKQIASINGLVKMIVDQLLQDDVPCLCEAFRVMTFCLQGGESVIWADALKSEQVLSRILWVVENALNHPLIENSVGLLLGVLESQQEVSAILLPQMMKLDLPNLLVNLLTFEMREFREEQNRERFTLLDLILRTIEALSIIDNYSQEICMNKELLQLLEELIKLHDKIEGLFDVYPFASDDTEAQTVIWSIIARVLKFVKERAFTAKKLEDLRSIFTLLAEKSESNGKYISISIFKEYIGIDRPLGDRVFDLASQKRKDQKLTFEDLVITKATCEKGTKDEIERFIYELLDVSDDGTVTRPDVETVLTAILDNLIQHENSDPKA